MALGQLSIRQGLITETNSEAIDLLTFRVKSDIRSALTLVEEAKMALEDLELGHAARRLCRCLCRTIPAIKSVWDLTQTASPANAGVKYASISTVVVGVRAVHSGLCTGHKPSGWEPVPKATRLRCW